jgi:Elongation factor Tu domain 2
MLQLLVKLTQAMMGERLMYISELQCTVLEVKVIEGLGTTIDVVLVNGVLHEGDTIVVCGLGGPIVTHIRSLLTPHPLKVCGRGQHLSFSCRDGALGARSQRPCPQLSPRLASQARILRDLFVPRARSHQHAPAILALQTRVGPINCFFLGGGGSNLQPGAREAA